MSLDRPYGEARLVVLETTMPWDVWQATLWLLAEARYCAYVQRIAGNLPIIFPWDEDE